MKTLSYIILVLLITICSCKQGSHVSQKLELVWQTAGFDTPESVCYDKENAVFYVSNIGGREPGAKDQNGFISKLGADGKIIQLKWIEGLNAPKGMAIVKNYLFVTDIDRLVAIDIAKGSIERIIPVEGSLFLNDITAGNDSMLYFTDSKKQTCFELKDSTRQIVAGTALKFLNGISMEGERLIAGIDNSIVTIDWNTGSWKTLVGNTGGIDGLVSLGNEKYLISDWFGKVQLVSPGNSNELLLDTTTKKDFNAADFYYDPAGQLLYIPTFFGNSVACYKLNLGN